MKAALAWLGALEDLVFFFVESSVCVCFFGKMKTKRKGVFFFFFASLLFGIIRLFQLLHEVQ